LKSAKKKKEQVQKKNLNSLPQMASSTTTQQVRWPPLLFSRPPGSSDNAASDICYQLVQPDGMVRAKTSRTKKKHARAQQ